MNLQIPKRLQKGDTVAIISLSSGIMGEGVMSAQKRLIEQRLQGFGLQVIYTPHALKGLDFIKAHPEARAADLKWAFAQDEVKMILCAIGGDDTYRTVSYLLEDVGFSQLVAEKPKIFMGYSDTTINHLIFQKLGLATYYGPSAIVDFGELADEMLPYTADWVRHLFSDEVPDILSSPIWYEERTDFGPEAFGTDRQVRPESHGYEVLYGDGTVTGALYGGCLESLGELVLGGRYEDEAAVNARYQLLPHHTAGKILFLETSEEKPSPERVQVLLAGLASVGFFKQATALLVGKPQDEQFYEAYKQVYQALGKAQDLPILYNMNFGHAHPRAILPIGQAVTVDLDRKTVSLTQSLAR
ncbi:MAG: LD-carboxypeptidase [Streptococcaceae bacterium]|jgi:muramoyltetrapeptide carboxypeptidase LdcA involved in peptidoglycan recycling|nr:LD-carboxypeptidase [Streptococcaceae bacterium]